MNALLRAAAAYRTTDVSAATDESPGRRVELAFGAVLAALASARQAADAADPARRGTQTSRALRLIALLQSSLDHQGAPELAANLDALYAYCTRRLLDVPFGDATALPEVIAIIAKLHNGWTRAMTSMAAGA